MIHLSRRNIDKSGKLDIKIDNVQINSFSSQKLLGLFIVMSSRIALLKQLSHYVPINVQKLFNQS